MRLVRLQSFARTNGKLLEGRLGRLSNCLQPFRKFQDARCVWLGALRGCPPSNGANWRHNVRLYPARLFHGRLIPWTHALPCQGSSLGPRLFLSSSLSLSKMLILSKGDLPSSSVRHFSLIDLLSLAIYPLLGDSLEDLIRCQNQFNNRLTGNNKVHLKVDGLEHNQYSSSWCRL